jgi:hypothetical protein
LASAVKFALEIELDHFHIAQGHADVSVSHHLHKRRQADAEAHHQYRTGTVRRHGFGYGGLQIAPKKSLRTQRS